MFLGNGGTCLPAGVCQACFHTVAPFARMIWFARPSVAGGTGGKFDHATMHRTLRSRVWVAAEARNLVARATATNPLIIDIEASLVHVHSDKQNAAGTKARSSPR